MAFKNDVSATNGNHCGRINRLVTVDRKSQLTGSFSATMMELFQKRYYKMTKVLMSFLGLWPEQPKSRRRLIHLFLSVLMLSIAITEVYNFIANYDNVDVVVECIPAIGLHTLTLMKCVVSTSHMDKLAKLLMYMEQDWKSRLDGDGSDILKKFAERARLIALAYAFYMLVGGVLYVSGPLLPLVFDIIIPLNESRSLEPLLPTKYWVEPDDYFLPILIHALVTTSVSMVIVVACDTMYSIYVLYACALFAELSEKIQDDVTNKDTSLNVSKIDDSTYHHMVDCVKKHKEAMKFCGLINSVYGLYFLLAFGLNIFLISCTGVQTVMRFQDPNLITRHIIFGVGQAAHALFLCWHGQSILDFSGDVHMAVYKSNWYNMSFRCRRLVCLLMLKSVQPCQLTGKDLFVLSLEAFTTIMKTAMSYFTVLRSFQ